MKDLLLVFPHRKGDSYRERNLEFILDFYEEWYPKVDKLVVEVHHEGPTFKTRENVQHHFQIMPLPHAQAPVMNLGVRLAKEMGKKFVYCIDNDIMVDPEALKYVYQKATRGELDYAHPFTMCFDLPESWDGTHEGITESFRDRKITGRTSFGRPCTGGAFFVDVDKYLEWGGTDEDFSSYGGEDDERHTRFLAKGAKYWRHDKASIIHLWHPRQVQTKENIDMIRKKSDWVDRPDKYEKRIV